MWVIPKDEEEPVIVVRLSRQLKQAILMNHILPLAGAMLPYQAIPDNSFPLAFDT